MEVRQYKEPSYVNTNQRLGMTSHSPRTPTASFWQATFTPPMDKGLKRWRKAPRHSPL